MPDVRIVDPLRPVAPDVPLDPPNLESETQAEAHVVSDLPPAQVVARLPADPVLAGTAVEETQEERIKRLRHELALEEGKVSGESTLDTTRAAPEDEKILIHFLEDGFTALGQMWHRGQELEFVVQRNADGQVTGSPAYLATFGQDGKTWVTMAEPHNEFEQSRRYGKLLFRRGAWPGEPWPSDDAAQLERTRNRVPPVPPSIATRRT